MVTLRFAYIHIFIIMSFVFSLALSGCSPVSKITIAPDFKPAPEKEIVYLMPFESTLVPAAIAETVFNELVDHLNDNNKQADIRWFSIIKEDPSQIPAEWLAKQVYLSGELWSYIENSGCCSSELRIKARLLLHEPLKKSPTLEIMVPLETFFEHDNSSIENERQKFANSLARELASQVLNALATHR